MQAVVLSTLERYQLCFCLFQLQTCTISCAALVPTAGPRAMPSRHGGATFTPLSRASGASKHASCNLTSSSSGDRYPTQNNRVTLTPRSEAVGAVEHASSDLASNNLAATLPGENNVGATLTRRIRARFPSSEELLAQIETLGTLAATVSAQMTKHPQPRRPPPVPHMEQVYRRSQVPPPASGAPSCTIPVRSGAVTLSPRTCSQTIESLSKAGGATEHAFADEWCDAIAFANIGLAGAAIQGIHWHTRHRPQLLTILKELLLQNVIGICLCEVGNGVDPLNQEGQKRFEHLALEAFDEAGASEHAPPQIFWGEGETMAMFRAEAQVQQLTPMTEIHMVDAWRTVGKFKVSAATKHGRAVSLLLFNQYQPKSTRRKFSFCQQKNLCTAVLQEALRFAHENPENIGFGFGGDAQCTTMPWKTAMLEVPKARMTFSGLQFMRGDSTRSGDLLVGAGTRGVTFEYHFQSWGQQHDPMIMRWCYRN